MSLFRRLRSTSLLTRFGVVSLLTDVSSEAVAAVLPLYITVVLGMGPLAYGRAEVTRTRLASLSPRCIGMYRSSIRELAALQPRLPSAGSGMFSSVGRTRPGWQ